MKSEQMTAREIALKEAEGRVASLDNKIVDLRVRSERLLANPLVQEHMQLVVKIRQANQTINECSQSIDWAASWWRWLWRPSMTVEEARSNLVIAREQLEEHCCRRKPIEEQLGDYQKTLRQIKDEIAELGYQRTIYAKVVASGGRRTYYELTRPATCMG